MTTATKLRHAPADWMPGLTRVVHADGRHGTFVRNSHPLPGVEPHGWLGVLVRFDGGRDLVDVDPADLMLTCPRDPFAAIAATLPTRYAPGATGRPYNYPGEALTWYPVGATGRPYNYPGEALTWYPVLYYPAGVESGSPWGRVERYPAERVDGSTGLSPIDSASIAVRRGDAAPRPLTGDPAGVWTVAQFVGIRDSAYDVYVTSQRDALAAWMEAWAIAAALNNNVLHRTGVAAEEIEVLLAAERRALSGPPLGEATYLPVGAEPGGEVVVYREQMRGMVGAFRPLLQPVTVAANGHSVYGLGPAGADALAAIRRHGAQHGGPRCRECGCTGERACPDGCSWLTLDGPAGPLCSACPTSSRRR